MKTVKQNIHFTVLSAFTISFCFFTSFLWAQEGTATGSCGCEKNGQPINWTGDCSPAGFAAHGCDGYGSGSSGASGSGGGNNASSNAASQLGAALGNAVIDAITGPSDEVKAQQTQVEQQKENEAQQEADQAKAQQDQQNQEKLERLNGEIKPLDGSDSTASSSDGGLKLKSLDDSSDSADSGESASDAVTPPTHQSTPVVNEQMLASADGVILTKRPVNLHKDKIWVENTNSYSVDVDVYMSSINANCTHTFKDATVPALGEACMGWVANVANNDPWPYTVGLNVSKTRYNGSFNYGP